MAPTDNNWALLAADEDSTHLPKNKWTSTHHHWANDSEQRQDNLPTVTSPNTHPQELPMMGENNNFNTPILQPNPPTLNSYFQPHTGVDISNNVNTNGNGDINVDNIFASMSEEESIFHQAPIMYTNTTNSNNIFHNFANMNRDNITVPSVATERIPIRKYSDCTNNFSGGTTVGTTITSRIRNTASPTLAPTRSESRSDIQRLNRLRSDGDVLSKSMGTTSFFPRLGLGNNNTNER